jgi:hypothetical protein
MNLYDFRTYADTHSADLSRWPQSLVKPALALIEADAEAKAYFDRALALDAELRLYAPGKPDLAALEARIMAELRKDGVKEKPRAGVLGRAFLFLPAPGLLAAAVIGFFLGLQPAHTAAQAESAFFYATDQVIAGDDIELSQEGLF